MAQGNAARCIANVLPFEGGYTNDRNDPGNWTGGKVGVGKLLGTKYGIAANTYPDLDIKNLTKDQAIEIYTKQWWPQIAGDSLPKGVDQITLDASINSGKGRGLPWTGSAAGIDGPYTAAKVAVAAAKAPDKVALIKKACAKRMGFLHGLKTFARYGNGWTRRVTSMEALGVKMALEAASALAPATAPPKPVNDNLKAEAAKAKKASNTNGAGAATTVGGGGAGTQQSAPDASSIDWSSGALITVAVIAILIIAGLFAYKWWMHRERAKAYEAAADGTLEEGGV